MKFGKEYESRMVQEWREAYMNYTNLKFILKQIRAFRLQHGSVDGSFRKKVSLYRAFSGLTVRHKGSSFKKNEDEVILVCPIESEGVEECYQTLFLMSASEGGDSELMFFRRLDEEFNKVLKFYNGKMKEVLGEARELNKQMDALIALRIKVEKNDFVEEIGVSKSGRSQDAKIGYDVNEGNDYRKDDGGMKENAGLKPVSLEILDHVKINITADTPVSTLKGILKSSNPNLGYNKEGLKIAHEQMKKAFMEFYQKLQLLKSYRFFNQMAFSKIMKKYDKITARNASKVYMEAVDNSPLGSSHEVVRLMERVDASFIKHFANGNRRKGMSILRPEARREKHRVTFSLGFLSGCSVALVVALAVIIHARDVLNSEGKNQYMENIFPLYSLFGFIILHMLMYAANVYFWKRYRVNYPFIFGFKQGTELGYREVLLLSSALAVLTLAAVLSNLDMEMDPGTKGFKMLTELVPLGLIVVVLLIAICPFNIIYRSSRYFLIVSTFHSICAPLYKVTLPDSFLADQLTSQVQALRSLEFYVCYYGWGDFIRRSNRCHENHVYKTFYFIVAIVPYWLRFAQCFRRTLEEKDAGHAFNGLKYLSTIVAVAMRTSYDLYRGSNWRIMAAVSSGFATIYNTYWDVIVDWGLLRWNSKNTLLRDRLLVPNKLVYFVAMVLNVLLRFAWMQTVLDFTGAPFLHGRTLISLVACLEIIRRGIWNFFRLENEHLNNVGKYRAINSVPLPFNYDDDGKDA